MTLPHAPRALLRGSPQQSRRSRADRGEPAPDRALTLRAYRAAHDLYERLEMLGMVADLGDVRRIRAALWERMERGQ